MNAAEKALQARNREQEARIMKVFEEAQKYHAESKENSYNDRDRKNRLAAAKKAIKLYTKCAEEGNAESMECLAEIYFDWGLDKKKEVYWCIKGAENDSMICMHELVWRYRDGVGVVQSESTSIKWQTCLQNKLKELYDEAMQKYKECEKNFRSYANGARQDESELKNADRELLYEAVSIFEKCAKCAHVNSMKALEEINAHWMNNHAMAMYWFSEWRSIEGR